MKPIRNLYPDSAPIARYRNRVIIAVGTVAGLLLTGCLAWWIDSATGGGGLVASICYAVGAVAVILLGWYWVRLVKGIGAVTEFLKHNKSSDLKVGGNAVINGLVEAINNRFSGNTNYIAELEKQLRYLQIKVQLLRRQKINTDAIIYSIRDAVVVIDEFDKLLMANEAAGKLFDFDFKQSQHKPIDELICEGGEKFADFLRHSRRSKVQASRREIELVDRGIFDCIVSCVYDERGQVCGTVGVFHDITREREISQMKNDFVNHVSHELKTPLASITAYSEMLIDNEANDEKTKKEFCTVIQEQAGRLNRLIEDILNTSRIESGLIRVEKSPISLAVLIEEQLKMIKGYADEREICLENIGRNPIVFDQVSADKDMISQVVVNLLSNAVKYTKAGGSVKVETEVDGSEGLVRVSVTDTGIGIPEEELKYVFDKFYRVGANKGQAKGSGLGLNLVKQIVEKVHNGRVFVSSEVGVGSTFGFELPLATSGTREMPVH